MNVQTVYKVCPFMFCTCVSNNFLLYSYPLHHHFCSFLPKRCVHKCVDELHKISCNSYYIIIDNTAATGGSKYFELGRQPHEIFYLKHLFPVMCNCLHSIHPNFSKILFYPCANSANSGFLPCYLIVMGDLV